MHARQSRPRVVASVVGAVVVALALGACGGTEAGEITSSRTTAPTPGATQTINVDAALRTTTEQAKPAILAAARRFNTCDARESAIERAERCRQEAAAEAALVTALAEDIRLLGGEQAYAVIVRSLDGMTSAAAKVAAQCSAARSQRCDQALAAFRASEQSVLWELDLTL